jgi:hypothetical protein
VLSRVEGGLDLGKEFRCILSWEESVWCKTQ